MANNQNEKRVELFTLPNNNKIDQGSPGNKGQDNSHLTKKYKFLATGAICFCSLAYGLTSYIIGPALNDMKIKLDVTTDSITVVFGCMLIGYTLGAVINGIIFNYMNRQLVLTVLLILMAFGVTAMPYCNKLGLLFGGAALCGFGAGGIDTAQVVWIMEMWGEESNTYLSGYQFFFALGTFISPLMSRPYLAEELHINTTSLTTSHPKMTLSSDMTVTPHTALSHNLTFSPNPTNSVTEYTESRIGIPFGIVGGLLLISGLVLLVLHFYRRYEPPVQTNEEFVCKCPNKWKLIYISLGLLTLAPYVGMEIMNFQLIATFATNSHLKLDGQDSALIQSLLGGPFALMRAIVFFISLKFWSSKTIYLNFVVIFIGNTLLFLFEYNHYSKTFLWAGAIITGTGFSSVFPTVYAFLESQFTISNNIGGIFVCMSGLMAAILPTLCGQFIEGEPLSLVYINYVCTGVIATTFIVFNFIILKKSKTRRLSEY